MFSYIIMYNPYNSHETVSFFTFLFLQTYFFYSENIAGD